MKKHSFFADTKLPVDQIKKKMEEKVIKPFFLNQLFLKVETIKTFKWKTMH